MANRNTWDRLVTSMTALMTTGLNGLANNGRALGAQFSPDTNVYATFALSLAQQGSARSDGARVLLYLLPSYDNGTTFAYGDASLEPSPNHLAGSFKFDAATSARTEFVERVELGAGLYKPLLVNLTGQAFAASGNVLSGAYFTLEMQ